MSLPSISDAMAVAADEDLAYGTWVRNTLFIKHNPTHLPAGSTG